MRPRHPASARWSAGESGNRRAGYTLRGGSSTAGSCSWLYLFKCSNLCIDELHTSERVLIFLREYPLRNLAGGVNLLRLYLKLPGCASGPEPVEHRDVQADEACISAVVNVNARRIDAVLEDETRLGEKFRSRSPRVC